MSNYSRADTKTQWFQDDYPGSDLELSEATAVLVIHTTETMDWPGYGGGKTAPNYTHKPSLLAAYGGRWRAHFPDEKSSRALRNQAGGVQTNTLNCIQLELIGTCDYAKRFSWTVNGRTYRAGKDYVYWPNATESQLEDVARFIADLHKRHGLRIRAPKPFIAYGPDSRVPGRLPASYGAHPFRMTFAEWRNVTGVVGHQHVPENSHGDPGALPINRLLELAETFARPKPAPAPAQPTDTSASRIWIGHASLQFSDTYAQMRHDVKAIFELQLDAFTFTEAHHSNPLGVLLREIGNSQGYDVHVDKFGCGVAVRKGYGRITRRGFMPGINGSRPGEPVYGPRGVAWVRVRTLSGENIGIGAVHYITGGNDPGDGHRWRENLKLSRVLGRFARNFGSGTNLALVGGDFNTVDKRSDVFHGQPLTTCWDELGKWPTTHPKSGNIDALASYDPDGRVKCRAATVLDDTEIFLYTDHYVVRATYDIKGRG